MNDEESAGGSAVGANGPAELARQLRETADRLMASWTGAASARPPALPSPPVPPATLSARQLQAVMDDIESRRAQVKALRVQLEKFDDQLGTLEASLRPLLEWTRTWADVEDAVARFWGTR
jgi:outer membrane protein TolC